MGRRSLDLYLIDIQSILRLDLEKIYRVGLKEKFIDDVIPASLNRDPSDAISLQLPALSR